MNKTDENNLDSAKKLVEHENRKKALRESGIGPFCRTVEDGEYETILKNGRKNKFLFLAVRPSDTINPDDAPSFDKEKFSYCATIIDNEKMGFEFRVFGANEESLIDFAEDQYLLSNKDLSNLGISKKGNSFFIPENYQRLTSEEIKEKSNSLLNTIKRKIKR